MFSSLTTMDYGMENDTGIASTAAVSSVTPNETVSTSPAPPIPFEDLTIPTCQWILYYDFNDSGVRLWDVIILIPNCLFLLYLLYGFRPAVSKLKASSSPIFTAFYGLIFAVSGIGLLRCIVSMTVNAATEVGDISDKVLWLLLRFFLLATELSVVIFGLAFGHLDSRTSIQRVLIVTFTIALGYSAVQGTLELKYDHPTFKGKSSSKVANGTETNYDLFAHGGMIFLFTTSIFFFMIYTAICLLPFTKIRERFHLPTKRLFYGYCGLLACLNLAQAVASLTLYLGSMKSLCVVDLTFYLYFSFYNPLVYGVFLFKFFQVSQTSLQFSYKPQEDYGHEDDQLSLPYSYAGVGKVEDQAPIFSYDSTHFDTQSSHSQSQNPTISINSDYSGSNHIDT